MRGACRKRADAQDGVVTQRTVHRFRETTLVIAQCAGNSGDEPRAERCRHRKTGGKPEVTQLGRQGFATRELERVVRLAQHAVAGNYDGRSECSGGRRQQQRHEDRVQHVQQAEWIRRTAGRETGAS